MELLKGFIEESLSHQSCVNMDVSSGSLDPAMTQHLFDLENGSACLQEVLGVCMSEAVGGFRYACLMETVGDVIADCVVENGPIGCGEVHKKSSVVDLRSCVGHIGDNGLEGLLRQRKS